MTTLLMCCCFCAIIIVNKLCLFAVESFIAFYCQSREIPGLLIGNPGKNPIPGFLMFNLESRDFPSYSEKSARSFEKKIRILDGAYIFG